MLLLGGLARPQVQSNQPEVDIHAPYVTTPHPVVHAMLKLAHTRKGDVVYDLGCGDGRIVIAAAKQYGARGVGVDINPERIQEARENARREGVESLVQFKEQNVYDVDLRAATLVTLYMLPEINRKLLPKLQRELKSGTRIVSHTFDMGEWKPTRTQNMDGEQLYLWRIRKKS
jgi:cyclopropane fatty-acyl-phospholipid synthase-like methyltransferase